ncbi:Rab-like protein 3 [Halotydeus destructor]|nr:Rab-like protein 3 [Halotydeus destructor]
MAATDKIKVLVLGDSGVGKTSLVNLIAHGKPIGSSSWTIGCSIEVKLHEYSEGTPSHKSVLLELWDIGGSRTHSTARSVFYNSFHGIILVHDLTNSKSHANLRKWLGEVFCSREARQESSFNVSVGVFLGAPPEEPLEFDTESFVEKNIPCLVVSTKIDLASTPTRRSRVSSVAEECCADEIQVDCNQSKSFAAASTNAVKLSRFFDKVVEKKYKAFNQMPPFMEKARRTVASNNFGMQKFSHLD